MTVNEKYNFWLNGADEQTAAELKAITSDENEIYERFYKNLEFGTGCMRGLICAGPN